MADLRKQLEKMGFTHVSTYIASGNIILKSKEPISEEKVEAMLQKQFGLSDTTNKVLVLTLEQLQSIVDNRPKGFGNQPGIYHSDVIFLIGIDATEAMPVFSPREGVDKVWPGEGVVYSQRLSAERTKSRLSKIVGTPVYHSMTIRTWGTTIKLLDLLKNLEVSK